jgi:hypothetical protein
MKFTGLTIITVLFCVLASTSALEILTSQWYTLEAISEHINLGTCERQEFTRGTHSQEQHLRFGPEHSPLLLVHNAEKRTHSNIYNPTGYARTYAVENLRTPNERARFMYWVIPPNKTHSVPSTKLAVYHQTQ